MIPEWAVWLILGLPLLSFILITAILRPFFNDKPKLSSSLTILCIGGSLVLSFWALLSVIDVGAEEHFKLDIGNRYEFLGDQFKGLTFGLMVDGLSAIMLVVVSGVSLLVQIYSLGYMKGDKGYHRYFAGMSLFTMAMLGVVLASNLAQIYVFWELVGLCSYMLIGFWFHKPSAAAAAKKAFIVTRIGDLGFLLGMLYMYFHVGTLDIAELHALAVGGILAGSVLTWGAIGIFAGAVGKSAQFPLHVWLPDAMEGPTPVSSLIHAATMVAAGVYLVARMFPLFMPVPGEFTTQMYVVAIVGAFTAIFAATMGLVAHDIKRVLAYCTVSQLGYMVLGLGTGAWAIAFFHLFNHAFCKCLLFQGAGSISHCTNTFDMRLMGGLRKGMKWTFFTFLIGSISMAGIWPLACFWSKDSIVHSAFVERNENPLLMVCFIFAIITVFMTAFYMFRAVFLTFFGEYKGGAPSEHGHGDEHHAGLHESPAVMIFPLVVLAILAVCSGWFGFINVEGGGLTNQNGAMFNEMLTEQPYNVAEVRLAEASFVGDNQMALDNAGISHYEVPEAIEWEEEHHPGFFQMIIPQSGEFPLGLVSVLVALAGIGLAYLMYIKKTISAEKVADKVRPVYKTFYNKYWMDNLYEKVVVENALYKGLFRFFAWCDSKIVDGVPNHIGEYIRDGSKQVRKLQSGQLQAYAFAIVVGVLIIVACFHIFT